MVDSIYREQMVMRHRPSNLDGSTEWSRRMQYHHKKGDLEDFKIGLQIKYEEKKRKKVSPFLHYAQQLLHLKT